MNISAYSDIGMVRHENQDAYAFFSINEQTAFGIVCDGMGGVGGGRYASRTATDIITEYVKEKLKYSALSGEMHDIIKGAVTKANDVLYQQSKEDRALYGMGTTMVAAIISGENLFVANIGDSRAYLLSGGVLQQISVDHSAVQEMVDSGQITREQARVHPQKNLITRAIGVDDYAEFDFFTYSMQENDLILLCSDGLSNYCSDDKLKELLCSNRPPDVLVQELVAFANGEGGRDNITALIIQK